MQNLEPAYQELKSAMTPMDREEFRDKLLENTNFFAKYAIEYMRSAGPGLCGFIQWAWQQYQLEVTPAHTEGWKGVEG